MGSGYHILRTQWCFPDSPPSRVQKVPLRYGWSGRGLDKNKNPSVMSSDGFLFYIVVNNLFL